MHPLRFALPLPYVPVRVTRGAVVAHIGTRLRLLAVELLSTAESLCSYKRVSLERSWLPCV